MRPLRILMASALEVWALANQGGAPSFYRTLEAYGRRGHAIDLVLPTVGANHQHGAPAQPPPSIPGVTFHTFHLPSLQESRLPLPALASKADQKLRFALLFPRLAGRAAATLLDRTSADLLYGYEVHGVLALRRLARTRRLPLVSRFQGTIIHPYLNSALQRLRRYEEVSALSTPADLIVMTDDGTRGDEVIARLNPAGADRLRFWRNGLELAELRPPAPAETEAARTALGVAPGDFLLVTATRLARWKRIDRAIDALARLRLAVPGARLIVVGDGEERPSLEGQAAALGLREQVRFVGGVPQSAVQPYLWAADVFLSTNDLSNVGNPLLEAMTAGRAIVTIDVGDTRDLITDDETGVLLPAGEPALIARALELLANDPARRRRLGSAAAAYARDHFWSWDDRLAAEIEAVERLVAEHAGRD
jgi:glycosyltransferase involved in cell wall biosynthesis